MSAMTKEYFLTLTANNKSLGIIRTEAEKYYGGLDSVEAPEFYFWNSVAANLAEWLKMPAKLRKVLEPWTPEKELAMKDRIVAHIKKQGGTVPPNLVAPW